MRAGPAAYRAQFLQRVAALEALLKVAIFALPFMLLTSLQSCATTRAQDSGAAVARKPAKYFVYITPKWRRGDLALRMRSS